MKGILTYLLLIGAIALNAQIVKEREVISSGGIETNTSTLQVSSTIGETIINTEQSGNSPLVLTQGFQQTTEKDSISFTLTTINASCVGRENGIAMIKIDSIKGCDTTVSEIRWSSGLTTMGNTSEVRNLTPGGYTVQVVTTDGCNKIFPFTIEYESNTPCLLNFFSGITPNNDGENDMWVIENIEAFPDNKVTIFNRLGGIVFEEKNYDNVNVVWKGQNLSGNELPSDTYFYVFESNNEVDKGWIELTRLK